jgi:hypothetical protein
VSLALPVGRPILERRVVLHGAQSGTAVPYGDSRVTERRVLADLRHHLPEASADGGARGVPGGSVGPDRVSEAPRPGLLLLLLIRTAPRLRKV